MSTMALLCFTLVLCVASGVQGGYMKYNTGGGPVEGKLNVHLVPHSHDDVGWLKTVDQCYFGLNNSIQGTSVQNTLDSVIAALLRDSNRKFVFVEQAFFQRWWIDQSEETQEMVRELVDSGQLEFINGGWCMHDEAATHYIDMIDQTTLGHLMIKKQFNVTPRAGWQIDPFGHSAVQAYLLGAELGFNSVHFARIDYQDRVKRKEEKSLEVIWRGSKTFGSSSQIFTNAFPIHYSPPDGFHFEIDDESILVQDDPLLFNYNVEQRVNDFIYAAVTQANVTRTNHIMWTMGDDFQYQYAETWYRQLDKLIHYVNKDGRVNTFYSTPSLYTDSEHSANESWPLKTDDYFPYAEAENAYYTGYYTSRPSLKGYIRQLSGYYMASRQLEFLVGRKAFGPNTFSLGDALGIAQHHDAITGTARQHTTNDYVKRLSIGATESELTVNLALSRLTDSNQGTNAPVNFNQCLLLNISYCPPTEDKIPEGKSLVVVAYNPLGWVQKDVIRIPVNHDDLVVRDSSGTTLEMQYIKIDNGTINLRSFYVEAYLGVSSKAPEFWLLFEASVPPLGWNTFFISNMGGKDLNGKSELLDMDLLKSDTVEVGPGPLVMSFSMASGQLKRMANTKTGADIPIQQSYLWYVSSNGDEESKASGAYIFRPTDSPPIAASTWLPLNIVRGNLVHEVHQQFNSWIYQVTRLFKDKEHAEIEFTIGPIPTDDSLGKEIITRMTANMVTNKTFYTDSNGRDFIQRVRDYRSEWSLDVNQPVAGNYYPVTLGIFMSDEKSEFSVLVDRAVGGSSIQDGELELMFHRRMVADDSRGVVGALDETVCVGDTCQGLTIRGKYYISINKLGTGSRWRRTFGQQIYSPLLLAFTQEEENYWRASQVTNTSSMDLDYSLPPNVAIVTLQELDDTNVLVRFAHLYEAGEDAEYSKLAEVDLKRVFANKMIKEVKETSLSANQGKSEMKTLQWTVEGESGVSPSPVKGAPLNETTLIVQLGPMEIRTFLLKF